MRQHTLALAIFCACLTTAACSDDQTAPSSQQASEESLPRPGAASGSVTGMPNPGRPTAMPQRSDDLATTNEDTAIATESETSLDPNLPMNPTQTGSAGEMMELPAETMPTMPAPVPDPVEAGNIPPPQS